MIELQETTVAKPAQQSKQKKSSPATPPPHRKIEGKAKLMRILSSAEDDALEGDQAAEAL